MASAWRQLASARPDVAETYRVSTTGCTSVALVGGRGPDRADKGRDRSARLASEGIRGPPISPHEYPWTTRLADVPTWPESPSDHFPQPPVPAGLGSVDDATRGRKRDCLRSCDPGQQMSQPALSRVPFSTITREWGRIGAIGFGGPPVHIALFRKLCIDEREWLTAHEFDDGIAATTLLPGPASTRLAIYCAWRLRGRLGAIVGGSASSSLAWPSSWLSRPFSCPPTRLFGCSEQRPERGRRYRRWHSTLPLRCSPRVGIGQGLDEPSKSAGSSTSSLVPLRPPRSAPSSSWY